jgi:hypothetical protein
MTRKTQTVIHMKEKIQCEVQYGFVGQGQWQSQWSNGITCKRELVESNVLFPGVLLWCWQDDVPLVLMHSRVFLKRSQDVLRMYDSHSEWFVLLHSR